MNDSKPILFSGPMVRAILDGRKTQTRRVVKLPKSKNLVYRFEGAWKDGGGELFPNYEYLHIPFRHITDKDWSDGTMQRHFCPYGEPIGDTLWVKETFQEIPDDGGTYVYRATDPDWDSTENWKWKPSIFMPREASRITLEITEVRVERLQEITAEDAKAEGIDQVRDEWSGACGDFDESLTDKQLFEILWEHINGPDSWKQNPWVWVIEFERIKC